MEFTITRMNRTNVSTDSATICFIGDDGETRIILEASFWELGRGRYSARIMRNGRVLHQYSKTGTGCPSRDEHSLTRWAAGFYRYSPLGI